MHFSYTISVMQLVSKEFRRIAINLNSSMEIVQKIIDQASDTDFWEGAQAKEFLAVIDILRQMHLDLMDEEGGPIALMMSSIDRMNRMVAEFPDQSQGYQGINALDW